MAKAEEDTEKKMLGSRCTIHPGWRGDGGSSAPPGVKVVVVMIMMSMAGSIAGP